MRNAPTPRAANRRLGHVYWPAYLYILPAFAIYAFFVLWPILQTLWRSFYEWDGLTTPRFIGLSNYARLWTDEVFRIALRNNVMFIVFYTLFPIVFALFLTMLLARREVRGLAFFRAGLFVPQVMASVVVGIAWLWIYNPVFGPLNKALTAIGLEILARPWLGDFDFALPAVGIIGTWVQYGFCMVLFIAGVQHIDESLYDAAKIDGATELQQLRYVTVPGLRNEVTIVMVTTLIAALRSFDLVFVTTRGGPGNQTMIVSLHLYQNAFVINRVGYAAAIAMVLTAAILLISYGVITVRLRTTAEG